MNKIRLVAFDLDGTIGDTIPLCIKAFKEAVAPYIGHELSDDDVIRTFGLNEQGMIASLVEAYHRGSCNGKRCKEYPGKPHWIWRNTTIKMSFTPYNLYLIFFGL